MENYVDNLSPKERSAFFAQCAYLAYEELKIVEMFFDNIDFTVRYIAEKDAECYVMIGGTDIIVACRGTQVTQFKDLKTDLQAWPKSTPHCPEGLVHFGFNKYVNRVWKPVAHHIMEHSDKKVWFCGHSLGAAMASIMAIYCQVNPLLTDPAGLYTFGSPRPGTKDFVAQGKKIYHERWVNCIDAVTSVPLWIMGYRHFGTMMYLNHWGNYRKVTATQHIKDRWRGFTAGLKEKKANHFANHSMLAYLDHVKRYRDDLENPQE